MRSQLLTCVVLASTFGHASLAGAQDAIFQSNEARTGVIDKLDLGAPPVVLWKVENEMIDGDTPEWGGIVAAGPRVYFSNRRGRLGAINAADGKELWHEQDEPEMAAAPLVMGDLVYIATSSGLWAFQANNGDIVWHFELSQGANEASPLLIGDLIVICGYDGLARGIDSQTGEERWSKDLVEGAPPSPPGFDGKTARLGTKPARPMVPASDGATLFQPIFDQSRLVALDGQTGELKWSFQSGGWMHANPVVDGDVIYIGSQDSKFYALDKSSGKVKWSFKAESRIESGAAVADGAVYFGSCDGRFYRLDAKTGAKQWSFACDKDAAGQPSAIYTAPLISGDTIFLAATEGQLYALSTSDGKLLWKMRPGPGEIVSDLATDGERLFLATRIDGKKVGQEALIAVGKKK